MAGATTVAQLQALVTADVSQAQKGLQGVKQDFDNVKKGNDVGTVNYRELADIANSVPGIMTPLGYLRDEACQAIVQAVRDYNAGLQAISDDPRLSIQARLDDTASLRDRATSQIDAIEQRGKNAIEQVRAAISKAVQEPQDVASQTLRELQVANGYQRMQLLLQAGQTLEQIAASAGQQGDKALIAALRVYAAPWLASQHRSERDVERVMAVIDQSETPMMSEKQLVARDLRDELEVGSSNLTTCAEMSRRNVSAAGMAWPVLNAWQQGRTLQVAPKIPGVR
jgi:hypothetical protein